MTAAHERHFELRVARAAALSPSAKIPEKVALAALELLTGPLLENPHRVGKPLRSPSVPAYSARRGSYRIIYLIDEEARIVNVTAIAHRKDAYGTFE